jgi:phosphomannomutase/phosphoglucomutase
MSTFFYKYFLNNANITTIDGVRVDYDNGWGLVRPSNTSPCLVLRFEADDEKTLGNIQEKFKVWLADNDITADF